MPNDFVSPESILGQLNLDKTMIAADFGCGSGGWTMPLAKILSEGRVFAVDLIKGPLLALESKAKLEKLLNIQTQTANVERGTKISSGSCDLVLATNLLFECENKRGVIEEAKRVLKPGGRILVIDWKKSASFGPRDRAVLPGEIKKIAAEVGLAVQSEFDAGAYHYGMVLVK